MIDLKLCPFCGGEAKITLFMGCYAVACTECPGAIVGGPYQTKEESAAAWNRRNEN